VCLLYARLLCECFFFLAERSGCTGINLEAGTSMYKNFGAAFRLH
jgi:hypothetical protein